jgi:DNA replication and repair protein RecF
LDATLCQVDAAYAAALAGYNRVLVQRNALLKALQDRRTNGGAQLEFWDGQLCAHGGQLLARRTLAIAELAALAGPLQRELVGGHALLQLDYRPSYSAGPTPNTQAQPELFAGAAPTAPGAAEITAGMLVRLRALRAEEIARGSTLIGPHRDELRFLEDGVDLGLYGSRGQGRTAVLALKLAQMDWMHTRTGEWPILLLDEVLAELDPQRRAQLLRRVTGAEQLLLATADADLFDAPFRARARIWEVAAGVVQQRP